jgi:hypothetical protein
VKALFFLVSWYILFVLCWPLAVLALVVWPIVWLISIPMKLIGISIGAVLALCWRCAAAGQDNSVPAGQDAWESRVV